MCWKTHTNAWINLKDEDFRITFSMRTQSQSPLHDDDNVGLSLLGCRADILGTNCKIPLHKKPDILTKDTLFMYIPVLLFHIPPPPSPFFSNRICQILTLLFFFSFFFTIVYLLFVLLLLYNNFQARTQNFLLKDWGSIVILCCILVVENLFCDVLKEL